MKQKKEKKETLPGAEEFYQYLCSLFPGKSVTVTPPQVTDRSYNMDYAKEYKILVDGEVIGTYRTFGPNPGESEFGREYSGKIPGYINELIVLSNRFAPPLKQEPEDQVSLIFSNSRFKAEPIYKGPGKIIMTPWQRQDGHENIPFPDSLHFGNGKQANRKSRRAKKKGVRV